MNEFLELFHPTAGLWLGVPYIIIWVEPWRDSLCHRKLLGAEFLTQAIFAEWVVCSVENFANVTAGIHGHSFLLLFLFEFFFEQADASLEFFYGRELLLESLDIVV